MFQQCAETIAVEIIIGSPGKENSIAASRITALSGAFTPVCGVIVIGICLLYTSDAADE